MLHNLSNTDRSCWWVECFSIQSTCLCMNMTSSKVVEDIRSTPINTYARHEKTSEATAGYVKCWWYKSTKQHECIEHSNMMRVSKINNIAQSLEISSLRGILTSSPHCITWGHVYHVSSMSKSTLITVSQSEDMILKSKSSDIVAPFRELKANVETGLRTPVLWTEVWERMMM